MPAPPTEVDATPGPATSASAAAAAATAAPATAAPAAVPATPTCDRLRALGEWNPAWEPFYRLDPAWAERFFAMATMPMLSGVLDAKTIEFIAIAVDASVTHLYAPGVQRHIAKALDLGATPQEIAAVLQLTSVLGIHTLSVGAPLLMDELARRAAAQP